VPELFIDEEGPRYDREWMIVDSTGRFISQREYPKLAQVKTALDFSKQVLRVQFPKGQEFQLPLARSSKASISPDFQVWDTKLSADLAPTEIHRTLSDLIGKSLRLVRYNSNSKRKMNSLSEDFPNETRFADSRPLSLLNLASLAELNRNLEKSIDIDRFRGNVIFHGTKAFEEVGFESWSAGSVKFSQKKLCSRCVMINIDQNLGEPQGPEPLKTLARVHTLERKVIFGSLYIPENSGSLKENDFIILQ